MFNWNIIKREISLNVEKIFTDKNKPVFKNFNESLDLFYKVVLVKCNNKLLDGLTRSVLPALHQAYVTDKGSINSLKVIAEELEPFYKKIILLIKNQDLTSDSKKTLGPLMIELNLSKKINNKTKSFPDLFNEANLLTYKNEDEYLEFLCHSYLIRNQVHNSPNWDYIEVFTNLRSILVSYFYPVLLYSKELNSAISKQIVEFAPEIEEKFDNQTRALYEFITHGNSTIEIKKQILNSSILYYLLSNSPSSINEISEHCNKQFNLTLESSLYKRTVSSLMTERKVLHDELDKDKIKLSESERTRLGKAISDFEFQERNFLFLINQTLIEYNLESHIDDLVTNLRVLLETNYENDIYEIYNQAFEVTNNENCYKFIKYLESISNSKDIANEIFFKLLLSCEENDFLHRVSASQVISKYTNSNQFQNYIRLQQRIVFMDAQLIIYILCVYYKDVNDFNIYYNITKDLLKHSEKHVNVKLVTSIHYVYEAAYHLKEALLLIPFEDLGFYEPKNSQNVFYQYYAYLKQNDHLDNDVNSFEDFISGFDLSYDDHFSKNYLQNTGRLIIQFLESFGIQVEHIIKPTSPARDDVFSAFKNALNILRRPRQEVTIENDATMLYYLTNKYNADQEPFFVTWDNAFYEARKRYLAQNKGCKNFFLYSPSKLLTTFSLTKFEINPESVTKEFLSILDADDLQSKATNFLDTLSFLFDIEKEERRKYISKLREFKEKYIIDQPLQLEETILEERSQPYNALFKEFTYHVNGKNPKFTLDELKELMSNDEYFDPLTQLLDKELEYYTQNFSFTDNLFISVGKLIKKLKNK
jgi:hypothetical protein